MLGRHHCVSDGARLAGLVGGWYFDYAFEVLEGLDSFQLSRTRFGLDCSSRLGKSWGGCCRHQLRLSWWADLGGTYQMVAHLPLPEAGGRVPEYVEVVDNGITRIYVGSRDQQAMRRQGQQK
jgi:hypothetical protein